MLSQMVFVSRQCLLWLNCCPCACFYYCCCADEPGLPCVKHYGFASDDCDFAGVCSCWPSEVGLYEIGMGLLALAFLPLIILYYGGLLIYNCCDKHGITGWDILTYAMYIIFLPFFGLYYGCMYSGVPCMRWCISKEGEDVTFLCLSSPGWLQKYNFEDVCRFFLHLSSALFFSMDTFDMVLDFIQVKKLADYCESGYAGWLGLMTVLASLVEYVLKPYLMYKKGKDVDDDVIYMTETEKADDTVYGRTSKGSSYSFNIFTPSGLLQYIEVTATMELVRATLRAHPPLHFWLTRGH